MASRAAKEAAKLIIESESYRRSLVARAAAGTLPPGIESMLWHYAYGKPTETIEMKVREDLSGLSDQQLAQRAEQIAAALRTGMFKTPEMPEVAEEEEAAYRHGVN